MKLVLLFILLIPFLVTGQEMLKMPKVTHSDKGVHTSELKLVKEIKSDFDEDLFLAVPWEISAGKDYFYVYDRKLRKCFIFDKQYKCVGRFLKAGQGPGEISNNDGGIAVRVGRDNNVYVADLIGDKVIQFSSIGQLKNDFRMFRVHKSDGVYPPVIDGEGNLYVLSTNKGIIDKMTLKPLKVLHTFLDQEENGKFVLYKPPLEKYRKVFPSATGWMAPNYFDVFYDLTPDGHLLIYLFRSSRVFLFRGDKLVRQFDIFIDRVLPVQRARGEEAFKKQKERDITRGTIWAPMFKSCFVAKDENFFFLQFHEENKSGTLFKFDLTGKLVEVIKNIHARIKDKRNGLFYGLSFKGRNPVILKKEKIK